MTVPSSILEPSGPRIFPKVTDANRSYWTGGVDGHLHMPRCRDCRRWASVGMTTCEACGGLAAAEAVSGRGCVFTYTLNAHQFHPDVRPPNLIAIVVLDEQDDLRVATNLVDCEEADVKIGMPVTVLFEHHGDIYYPVFAPAAAESEDPGTSGPGAE
jgi:uncharacterized protein